MQSNEITPTDAPHYSSNPRPEPDARNTAWPWTADYRTHYIKMPDGRLFYVRRVTKADIDALTLQVDLCALAVYAAHALQTARDEGVRKCLAYIMRHATRRIADAYLTHAPQVKACEAA